MLVPGKRGIGFAVGKEPVASLLLDTVCQSSLPIYISETNDTWTKTGQQAVSLEQVYHPALIDEVGFRSRVRFQEVHMCDLSDLKNDKADFLWTSVLLSISGHSRADLTSLRRR